MLRLLFGVRDLRAELHANLRASLERIARLAEDTADDRPSTAHSSSATRLTVDHTHAVEGDPQNPLTLFLVDAWT